MSQNHESKDSTHHYDLVRFLNSQESIYLQVIAELQRGHKESHWMWFIFPQLKGLGRSSTSEFYGIANIEEARAYLNDPILGTRLKECSEILLKTETDLASDIFGFTDGLKLKSSMTLFSIVSAQESIFSKVLDKFFRGISDYRTIELIKAES